MNPINQDVDDKAAQPAQDSEKRRQILNGAREVFLSRGFDAASMGEIARVAGVSKGTLYFYFESKQDLFAALVQEECAQTADRLFVLDDANPDTRAALIEIGNSYVHAMVRPEYLATMRIVIAVAEKFPDIARLFLEAGPVAGVDRLSSWLDARVARGEFAIPDTRLAAWQFLVGCHAPAVMPMLFGNAPAPKAQCVSYLVDSMVDNFLHAFQGPAGAPAEGPAPSPVSGGR